MRMTGDMVTVSSPSKEGCRIRQPTPESSLLLAGACKEVCEFCFSSAEHKKKEGKEKRDTVSTQHICKITDQR
jgi:pyruvate formate-lyase activating enzyme-like uncharacterized protein